MRKAFALVIGIGAASCGVWLTVWVLFVGGVREIVDAVNRHPTPSGPIAWGIVKIVFCEVGMTVGYLGFAAAMAIWPSPRSIRRRHPGPSNREVERRWESLIHEREGA